MLKQRLQQKLIQKLSPRQILLMNLIHLPMASLEERIKEEIEDNPALEEGKEENEEDNVIEDFDEEEHKEDSSMEALNEFDLSDYMDDDIPSYKLRVNNRSKDDEDKDIPLSSKNSFQDILISQLGLQSLDEHQKEITEYLIGNIDDSGYLRRELSSIVDDLAFIQNITTTEEELLSLLKIIQEFDPPGVGARDLQECLLLQLNRKNEKSQLISNARIVVEQYFNEFTRKRYEKIASNMGISNNQLKNIINEILKLNPKPGNAIGETEKFNQEIIPDFIVTNNNDELELSLHSKNSPDLKVNMTYANMIGDYQKSQYKPNSAQKEALLFAKKKLDSAMWFIDAIKQREATLLITMQAIIEFQKEFFLEGDEMLLKPMILKDIASNVNLDISTISRVSNSKYVQTPYGIYSLKYFFSESVITRNGIDISTREVKKVLQNCVDLEDKKNPLTDEEIGSQLKEKGYKIARRTIAKYREQLHIPTARLRKML